MLAANIICSSKTFSTHSANKYFSQVFYETPYHFPILLHELTRRLTPTCTVFDHLDLHLSFSDVNGKKTCGRNILKLTFQY